MTANRYLDLEAHNDAICALVPAHVSLRPVLALELKKVWYTGARILEIGCGPGDATLPILESTLADMDLLDVSSSMLEVCKRRLAPYADRLTYYCADALEHLLGSKPYDIIHSSWTLHNFPQADKTILLQAIFDHLNPDGAFLLMDKVMPTHGGDILFKAQLERYKLLPDDVCAAITEHEMHDISPEYRMDEVPLKAQLAGIGFSDIKIAMREERDIVLTARRGLQTQAL